MVESGAFREDLFYRLNGASLKLPPLRERADKAFLIDRVFAELAEGRPGNPHLRGDAISALLAYPWPGNIRELRNVLQYALATCEGDEITVQDLPDECLPRTLSRPQPASRGGAGTRVGRGLARDDASPSLERQCRGARTRRVTADDVLPHAPAGDRGADLT